ncbi:hypothetical protein evm_002233 [Chilo suppressalis]|nr:hypothetical protein evm_002233 [Chilo suppressalis]
MKNQKQPSLWLNNNIISCHQNLILAMAEHDHEEIPEVEAQLLSEYKDGQLQIVEVRPFEKDVMLQGEVVNSLSELETGSDAKYIQLVNAGDKPMMSLDLLNLTLVKSQDGTESYRLLANGETPGDGETTVTCVLASSDNEGNEDAENQDYMIMESDTGPVMFLQSSLPNDNITTTGTELHTVNVSFDANDDDIQLADNNVKILKSTPAAEKVKKLTPVEILERAKALQKAKALIASANTSNRRYVRRKRKSDLPPPHELLSTPGFKLFLYSCKYCNFKCNATKEMTAHRIAEHSGGGNGSKWRSGGRSDRITMQCARCPFKGLNIKQLHA